MKYIQILEKKVIERTNGVPYLVRWNIFGLGKDSQFFSVKVHNILISDDACMHDHPWPFLSIILKNGYKETAEWTSRCNPGKKWSEPEWDNKSCMWVAHKKFKPGNMLYRPPHWTHKLEIDKPCWTLVFTFRKVRTWGFCTPKGWIQWRKYSREKDC
jgi:hypothetical protein